MPTEFHKPDMAGWSLEDRIVYNQLLAGNGGRGTCYICKVDVDPRSREYRGAGVCPHCYDHDLPPLRLARKVKS